MSYIKVSKDMPEDPRLLDVALEGADILQALITSTDVTARCHVLRNVTLGALVTLWCYADRYVLSDNSLPVTLPGLASVVGLPVDILQRFPECWLRVRADGRVELPGYVGKNRVVGKDLRKTDAQQREAARLRQQRHRAKKRQTNSVTPDATRDRPVNVTPGHARTGTGTGTNRPVPGPRAGPLASASGRLAIRPETRNGNGAGHGAAPRRAFEPKTPDTLRSDVQMLTAQGMAPPDIARVLAQHGITQADVERWISEEHSAGVNNRGTPTC